jgi:hypothetical protein
MKRPQTLLLPCCAQERVRVRRRAVTFSAYHAIWKVELRATEMSNGVPRTVLPLKRDFGYPETIGQTLDVAATVRSNERPTRVSLHKRDSVAESNHQQGLFCLGHQKHHASKPQQAHAPAPILPRKHPYFLAAHVPRHLRSWHRWNSNGSKCSRRRSPNGAHLTPLLAGNTLYATLLTAHL